MKRAIFCGLVVVLAGLLYIASPFYAAWSLREAIRKADTPTIAAKIEWVPVRESLKASIAKHAQLLPEANAAGAAVTPTLWQRVKSAFGASMLDRFIETYVTPEGLPKLFQYRRTWNETVRGEEDESKLDLAARVRRFYDRIVRAEFQSLTRVEIEMIDRSQADRRYVSVLELHGTDWKLTSLKIVGAGAATTAPVAAVQ